MISDDKWDGKRITFHIQKHRYPENKYICITFIPTIVIEIDEDWIETSIIFLWFELAMLVMRGKKK